MQRKKVLDKLRQRVYNKHVITTQGNLQHIITNFSKERMDIKNDKTQQITQQGLRHRHRPLYRLYILRTSFQDLHRQRRDGRGLHLIRTFGHGGRDPGYVELRIKARRSRKAPEKDLSKTRPKIEIHYNRKKEGLCPPFFGRATQHPLKKGFQETGSHKDTLYSFTDHKIRKGLLAGSPFQDNTFAAPIKARSRSFSGSGAPSRRPPAEWSCRRRWHLPPQHRQPRPSDSG